MNTAWITYKLERRAEIDDICIKLTGWRQRSYPLEVYAGEHLIWSGNTEKSLGYVHLMIDRPVRSDEDNHPFEGGYSGFRCIRPNHRSCGTQGGELDLSKLKEARRYTMNSG